jgi:hypothetical protein
MGALTGTHIIKAAKMKRIGLNSGVLVSDSSGLKT